MSRSQAQQTLFIPGAIPIAADTTSNPNLSWLQLPVPQDPNQSVITSPDDFIMWDLDQTALESLTSTSVQSAQSAYSPTYPSFASPRYGDGVQMPSSDELPGPPDWYVSNHTPVSRSEVPNAASKSDSESTRTKERRRQQNRLAQRAYRARKENLAADLETKLHELEKEHRQVREQNAAMAMEIENLKRQMNAWTTGEPGC